MEDVDAGSTRETPVLESGNQELEETLVIRQEEFPELDDRNEDSVEELTDKKVEKIYVDSAK